eukprot:TRINITY_DN116333_c0_g1_i1.p1 TRINITY_DN116333_c0_g1~~TRINITY_DN116333_c0_g1_i1.p1  ORF type:complete len:123 (+),score=13.45 TRINITY_DN116333_c0_g1_i1:70-438(+)
MSHGKKIYDDFEYKEEDTCILIYPSGGADKSKPNDGKVWQDKPMTARFTVHVGVNKTHGQNERTMTDAEALKAARDDFQVKFDTETKAIQHRGDQKVVPRRGSEQTWVYDPAKVKCTCSNRT